MSGVNGRYYSFIVSKLPFLMCSQQSGWAEWLQGQPEHSRLSEHISFVI